MGCAVPYRWKLIAWDPGATHLIPTDSAVLYSTPCMGDAVQPRRAKFESVAIGTRHTTTRVLKRSHTSRALTRRWAWYIPVLR
jgi:hypothetical protein